MVELKTKLQQYLEKKYNVIESFKQRNIKVVSPNSYGVIQDNFKIIVSDLEPIIEEYTNTRVLEEQLKLLDNIQIFYLSCHSENEGIFDKEKFENFLIQLQEKEVKQP
jgi:hypothetical protein